MPTIETLVERPEPVTPGASGAEVFARFAREPDTLVLPIVDNGRPVGLIERTAFLLKMASPFGQALYSGRSIVHVMDAEPVVVEAGLETDDFCDILLKGGSSDLFRGFIVTRNGLYDGVGTAATLLRAINDRHNRQSREIAEQAVVLTDVRTQALTSTANTHTPASRPITRVEGSASTVGSAPRPSSVTETPSARVVGTATRSGPSGLASNQLTTRPPARVIARINPLRTVIRCQRRVKGRRLSQNTTPSPAIRTTAAPAMNHHTGIPSSDDASTASIAGPGSPLPATASSNVRCPLMTCPSAEVTR